jgi:hypothetical protein
LFSGVMSRLRHLVCTAVWRSVPRIGCTLFHSSIAAPERNWRPRRFKANNINIKVIQDLYFQSLSSLSQDTTLLGITVSSGFIVTSLDRSPPSSSLYASHHHPKANKSTKANPTKETQIWVDNSRKELGCRPDPTLSNLPTARDKRPV